MKPGLEHSGVHARMAIMDSGLTIRPVAAPVASEYVRPGADAGQTPVATDLQGAKAVTTTPKVAPAPDTNSTPNNAPQSAAASTAAFTQRFTIDPQTREVIYRLVDARTQQVIQQVPDESLLASRAYANAIQNGATTLEAQVQANITT
jgi:hypothetical protein